MHLSKALVNPLGLIPLATGHTVLETQHELHDTARTAANFSHEAGGMN